LKLFNLTQKILLSNNVIIADTFFSRMKGLLGRSSLPDGEALLITRCNSIHMLFMRFAIDVVFLDKNDVVVGLVRSIKPFRLSPIFFRSCCAVELKEGSIEKTGTKVGDKIQVVKEEG